MLCYIVDKDPAIRQLIASIAQSTTNTAVAQFCSAEQVMQTLPGVIAAGGKLPALIVTDLDLPGVDGIGLTAWLKSEPAVANIPIIILSEDGSEDTLGWAFSAGAHDFAVKPIKSRELLSRLRAALTWSAAMDARQIAEKRTLQELQLNRAMVNSLSNMGEGLMVIGQGKFTFVN